MESKKAPRIHDLVKTRTVVATLVLAVLAVFGMVMIMGHSSPHRADRAALTAGDLSSRNDIARDQPSSLEVPREKSNQDLITSSVVVRFDAAIPLKSQLDQLRRNARNGDQYSSCILGHALDICLDEMESDVNNPLELTSEKSIERGAEEDISKIARNLNWIERRKKMCANLSQSDILERDEWLLNSAKNGNVYSMAKFVLKPKSSSFLRFEDADMIATYTKSAEDMLNRAAESGVPEAIEAVYRAYDLGEITTYSGTFKVKADPVRAIAAGRALLVSADLPEKSRIEARIGELESTLSNEQRTLLRTMENRYRSRLSSGHSSSRAPEDFCGQQASHQTKIFDPAT
jgi:hypothetical protein